ncbi:MAG: ATP-binding protein [Actinomycetota bacterium]|nr:ATP-binding protein [Actinomycetota bacterium]
MSASAAQVQFAAELVLFLAAASGLAVVALRGRLLGLEPPSRVAVVVGFTALAAAAFLHGSQLVADGDAAAVVALRLAGAAAAGLGSWAWATNQAARRLLWAGVALVALAVGLEVGFEGVTPEVSLAAGGIALGASVVVASRRSIATRIAASAAVTLLIVVLVLGVALSAVLVSTVEQGELDRLESRARNEAAAATATYRARLADAKVVAASLATQRIEVLQPLLASPAPSAALSPELDRLSSRFLSDVSLAYVARSGQVHGVAGLDEATVVGLAGSDVVGQAMASADSRGSVVVVADQALAVGVQPVLASVDGERQLLGVALAASRLDETYLSVTSADDEDLAAALVGRNGVVASEGAQPPLAAVGRMVRAALDEGRGTSSVVGERFVAVAPVRAADGRPVLAMVASSPTTLVEATRSSLFRSLFLIALVGSFLALLLASVIGERIGSGLRRLTSVAEAIQRGDLGVRAGIATDDEVGVLGTTVDSMAASVQEKTATESRLRGRLEAVVAGMGEALVAVDPAGRVTDFNQAAEELVGMRAGEVRGRPVEEVLRLGSEDGSPLADGMRTGASARWSTAAWAERVDGSRVPVAVSAGPLRVEGAGADGTVLVLRDLRREREIEQMKTEFLSRVGHELRTPLTGVIGYAELLNRKEVPAERAQQWHQEILRQSEALLRIVKMLEFFAEEAAGRVLLRTEEVDPRAVVDDVVARWRRQVGQRLPIRRRVARRLPTVAADREWLTFSLDELVDNAVKFSPDGGEIVVTAVPGRGGGVELSVSDQGKGMSGPEKEQAFVDFVQGDSSDTRRYGGLGLGLALVQRVARAHDGRVTCRSAPGKGTTVSISLPALPKNQG